MPYPPFPFPFSYLPEGMQKQLEAYSNNPYANIKMPGSIMPGSKNNPMVNPYAGPPEYQDGFEIVPDTAIPLSSYKLQNLPKQQSTIKDVMDTPWPELNKDFVNQAMGPEKVEYDPFTGLPIKKQFDPNALPNFGLILEGPNVSLDIFPYKDDVEYIRAQRQQEPEIDLPPRYERFEGKIFEVIPEKTTNTNETINSLNSLTRIDKEPETEIDKINTSTEPKTPKNKFGTPEAYYLGKSMLDATALINNMVQPQPPSIQMKNTYFERQRLNPEPYDTMRSQMRDQGTQAYRLQRENISQASDLMKGLAAVTSGTQQGLMQVGMQQAGAEQAVSNANQQISMQEQAGIAQTQNQETLTNYNIQSAAQQIKDQMISAQLARLGDTVGAYAKYSNMKDIVSKQEIINKAAIQSTNEIQNAMLQYQLQKDAMDSEEYKSAWAQHWNKALDQMSIDKVKDQKYNLVKEYYGETTPNYSDYRRRATDPAFVQDYYLKRNSYDMFQKLYPGGVAPDRSKYANDEDYNTALADFQKYEKESKAYGENKTYKAFEQEQDFWKTISAEKDEASERKKFADIYMKDRGIFTTEQFMAAIQASLERSRQTLEV